MWQAVGIVFREPMLAVLLLGCSSGRAEPTSATCPAFTAGVRTPVVVQSTFELVAGVADMRYPAVIDESGIYWFDDAGTLYARAHGAGQEPIVLRSAPTEPFWLVAMVGSESTLYWAEATAVTEPAFGIPPPGRLYSMPTAGGEVSLLLDDPDAVLTPLAVVDERVVFLREAVDGGLFALSQDGSQERLAPDLDPYAVRILAGELYWNEAGGQDDDGSYYTYLWHANLDGSNAELIARSEGGHVLADRDFVLWLDERVHTEPTLILDQNFVMLDRKTDCVQPLPALGQSISPGGSVMDGRHVYWDTYNGLDGISPGQPDPVTPLIRVDLRSGAIEQIVTSGFELELGDDLMGQTATDLYYSLHGELVAIRKP